MHETSVGGSQAIDDVATVALAMGNNSDGQLGIGIPGDDEDKVFEPRAVAAPEGLGIVSASASLKHTTLLTSDGVVYTCGDNDEGQLCRSGKRTKPLKVDSIEHLPIGDVVVGDGFTVMAARLDGRLLGAGRGERGQLGMGGADREHKEKVKFSSALGDEQLLALSSGEAHCMGLCRSGRVLAFGENKHGQHGVGDFVSSATPRPVVSLQCRPVVRICCGAAHTLARTSTGLLWSWGCNGHGQLGLGDFKTRFRPEQVKGLRVSRCVDVAAGNRHTLALSERGLVFAFGAGGCGQLGSGGIAESEPCPRSVDALREVGRCLLVACGHSHSAALLWNEDAEREYMYVWGLGSSGQLGLPLNSLQERKFALLPQKRTLPAEHKGLRVMDIVSGPLSHHTILLLAPAYGTSGHEQRQQTPLRHSLRTAIDAEALLTTLRKLKLDQAQGQQLKNLMKAVGSAFSSVSVLNASFRNKAAQLGLSEEASGVDMLTVRKAYCTLVFELQSSDLIATLGRATLSICDELSKQRLPTDDPENLCIFLMIFENPLLLGEQRTSLFPGYHLALQKLTSAVLSLPSEALRLVLGWLKRLPSEYFARVVDVMQQYVTFTLTQPGQSQTDASAAVLMLQTLWDLNIEMNGILPEWCFHNRAVSQSEDLYEHYGQWKQQQSCVFSYCRYPFLLDAEAKRRLLAFDSKLFMEAAMQELVSHIMRQGLPADVTLQQFTHFRVRRERLLFDFCGQLWWRMQHRSECLKLPLVVEFVGELGIDAGGLRKECLQLVLRQLHERTSLFFELEELPGLLWFRPTTEPWASNSDDMMEPASQLDLYDHGWAQHLPAIAGAIVGLAAYNGIHLDLRLHPLIYRFLVRRSVSACFEDLRSMHPTLHRSLARIRCEDVSDLGLSWVVRLPGAETDLNLAEKLPQKAHAEASFSESVQLADVQHFTEAYAHAAVVGGVQEQLDGFVETAIKCMALGDAFTLCTASDLELLVCGSSDLTNFQDLESNCTYSNGYHSDSRVVRFFWEVVQNMVEVWRRRLLLFCTGCDRAPILGLKELHFVISRSTSATDHLPTANTCVNQLNLPEYDSLEMMRDRLYAALEHNTGFGFA